MTTNTQRAVLIGRFQPFHQGHLYLVQESFKQCDALTIILGSCQQPTTPKNPFDFEERAELIRANLLAHDKDYGTNWTQHTILLPNEDLPYDDEHWAKTVIDSIHFQHPNDDIYLVGHRKDSSCFYLELFEPWPLLHIDNYKGINATDIRKHWLNDDTLDPDKPTQTSLIFLRDYENNPNFTALKEAYQFIQSEKSSWANAPYPVKFVTTDCVLIHGDDIALIQRKNHPGKGLWALPGGHLETAETIKAGLVRELIEETGLTIDLLDLMKRIEAIKVFDHPDRSLAGRVITHAGLIDISDLEKPELEAQDDAQDAMWYPLKEIASLRTKLHDDHYHIIQHFIDINCTE